MWEIRYSCVEYLIKPLCIVENEMCSVLLKEVHSNESVT